MELSQSALAMLLLVGLPVGAAISLAYALTCPSGQSNSLATRVFIHVKDFVFVVLAGLLAVLLVYYVNHGEFRYPVLFGMLGGYVLTHAMLARLVCRVRDAVLRVLAAPIVWIWSFTLGRLFARVRMAGQIKLTEKKACELEMLASNGF